MLYLSVVTPIISEHVGLIDATTMSRFLVWVQDVKETEFLLSPESISKFPPTPTQAQTLAKIDCKSDGIGIENRKIVLVLNMCWGELYSGIEISREEFLTLFDTCYNFVSEIDDLEIERLVRIVIQLAQEPMKSSVWKPRAFHHVKLLIDGLCKHSRYLLETF